MPQIRTDSNGDKYIEIPAFAGEATRLTLIRSGRHGPGLGVRIQHEGLGGSEPGPEVAVESLGEVVNAVVRLLTD